MSADSELQPLVKTRGRKASLLLALAAAFLVVALLVGFWVWQSARNAEALARFPDRVELYSATWAPGAPGVVRMQLRLIRRDGQTFDPRSGVTLTNPGSGGGRLHYVRGWIAHRAHSPTHQVLMNFRQAVQLPPRHRGPVRIELNGWTQPRFRDPWLVRLKALMGIQSPPRLTVPFYPLENGAVLLPPLLGKESKTHR